jgi:hypothetical protein
MACGSDDREGESPSRPVFVKRLTRELTQPPRRPGGLGRPG